MSRIFVGQKKLIAEKNHICGTFWTDAAVSENLIRFFFLPKKHKLLTPSWAQNEIDGWQVRTKTDGWTRVTLYALSTSLRMAGAYHINPPIRRFVYKTGAVFGPFPGRILLLLNYKTG